MADDRGDDATDRDPPRTARSPEQPAGDPAADDGPAPDGRPVDGAAGRPDDGPAGEERPGTEFWWQYGVRRDAGEDDDAALGTGYGMGRRAERSPEDLLRGPGQAGAGLEGISRAELREHYGIVRTFFKRRAHWYRSFQRQLTQAWLRDTYDQYLAATVRRMVAIVAVSAAVGACLAGGLLAAARLGSLPGLRRQVGIGLGLGAGSLAPLVLGAVVGLGLLGAGLYWAWHRVVRLRSRIARRRRSINHNLPYAVTFMYALARAGVNFDRILVRLAEAESTYGAVAQEFDRVVRDMTMFGNNLYIGLENLGAVTQSKELERFTDDVMTVLETGGDLTSFLRDEIDAQLTTAVEQQERFVERLELLSEVFVVGFVAAPLFVLVVLIVVSFLGADTVPMIGLLVYAVFPLGLAGFVLLVDVLSQPFRVTAADLSGRRDRPSPPPASPDDPGWRRRYERDKRLQGLRERAAAQLQTISDDPGRAFLFSVPIALAMTGVALWTGAASAGWSALLADPLLVTVELAVAPVVVATAPVALVHEYRVRRNAAFERRFPDLLDLLAASNRRGLSLTRGIDIVAASASGRVATELERLRNDIAWNFDTPVAFEAFGSRLGSPDLSRTAKLIAEGSRVTSDLYPVLDVAATDTAQRLKLKRRRRQSLQSYLAIVVIGFLVYLLVVLTLSANFLDPIEAFGAVEAASGEAPVSLGAIPVDRLRVLLLHSALIQGFGSGLLAGKLAEDSLYSGLKYGLALVVLAAAAFALV